MQSVTFEEHRPVRVEALPRWQSRLRGCGATRRYASVAVTGHPVFGRSLRRSLRAIPSGDPFGPGSPLQSPLRSDFRFHPYRLRSLALAARSCTSYK